MSSDIGQIALTGIGYYFGGPLGGIIGGAIGQSIFAEDLTFQSEGPRLGDLTVQTSAYGKVIPNIYGAVRIAGNVIWSAGIEETRHRETTSQGGKGGGPEVSSTTVTYTYSCSFAVAFCKGEASAVRRIWADGKLIYDFSEQGDEEDVDTAARVLSSLDLMDGISIYTGTETQTADPLIEAHETDVPGFRGLVYIVFEDFQLGDYGNRIPNLTAEIVMPDADSRTVLSLESVETYDGDLWNNSAADLSIGNVHQLFVGQWGSGYSSSVVYGYSVENGNVFYEGQFSLSSNKGFAVGVSDVPIIVNQDGSTDYDVNFPGAVDDGIYSLTGANINVGENLGVTQVRFVKDGRHLFLGANGFGSKRIYKANLDTESVVARSAVMVDYVAAMDVSDSYLYALSVGTRTVYKLNRATMALEETITLDYGGSGVNRSIRVKSDDEYYIHSGSNLISVIDGVATQENIGITSRDHEVFDVKDGVVYVHNSGTGVSATISHRLSYPSVTAATHELSDIVTSICEDAGLSSGDLDVTDLTDDVKGYISSRESSARALIEQLQKVYLFDVVESDYSIEFIKRGNGDAVSVDANDLAAGIERQQPDQLTRKRASELELPVSVSIVHMNPDADHQSNVETAQRLITASTATLSYDLPLVMDPDLAAQTADILLRRAWIEREHYIGSLPTQYLAINPGDVLGVTINSVVHSILVTEVSYQIPGVLMFKGVSEDTANYTSSVSGGVGGFTAQTVTAKPRTRLAMLDIPMLRDVDNSNGYYVAGCGYQAGWIAATLYRSIDDGDTWSSIIGITSEAVIGRATGTLPDGISTIIDYENEVTIELVRGELSSSTESAVLNGANACLLGGELLHFITATLNGDGTYTLSGLLRGRKGTEWAMSEHAADETFVLLDSTTLVNVPQDADSIGTEYDYKPVSAGRSLATTESRAFTNNAVRLKPLSPVHIQGVRDGSNNLSITWVRRGRLAAEWRDYVDVPLGEDSESYEVDIMDGASVLRTISSSSKSASYTAAQQTTDGLTPGDPVEVNIYQLSATVGRGYAGNATI